MPTLDVPADQDEPADESPTDPGGPRGRWRRRVAVAAVVACVAGAGVAVLNWPRSSTVRTFHQPASVTYPDGRAHAAKLVRRESLATDLGLRAEQHEVIIGSGAEGGYGHRVRLAATGGDPADLDVTWEAAGAWLEYSTGHRVFVPAASFMYGR